MNVDNIDRVRGNRTPGPNLDRKINCPIISSKEMRKLNINNVQNKKFRNNQIKTAKYNM